jgi:hypothetical protein
MGLGPIRAGESPQRADPAGEALDKLGPRNILGIQHRAYQFAKLMRQGAQADPEKMKSTLTWLSKAEPRRLGNALSRAFRKPDGSPDSEAIQKALDMIKAARAPMPSTSPFGR